jgi:hypothetical protein
MAVDVVGMGSAVSNFFSQKVMPVLISIINFFVGLGPEALKRMFLALVMGFFIYKAVKAWLGSKFISIALSIVIAILGIRILPLNIINLVFTPWILAFFVGFFWIIMLVFKTSWRIRTFILFASMILFFALFFFFGRERIYLIMGIIFIVFLIIDGPINKSLFKSEKHAERLAELEARIKQLSEEIDSLAGVENSAQSVVTLKNERKKLERELSKYV